jgi:hypothetical protein
MNPGMCQGLVLMLLLPLSPVAQQGPPADRFQPLAFLVGQWEGTSNGRPGKGSVRREYTRVLNGRFIQGRNRSQYPAQEKNPKGEIHEHEDWISFDRIRKRFVLRQFHVEGFVNQYVEEPGSTPTRLVFTSEAIENIPAGWRARDVRRAWTGRYRGDLRACRSGEAFRGVLAGAAEANYAVTSPPESNQLRPCLCFVFRAGIST